MSNSPTVKFGKVDPGLETEKPILTPVNGTKDFTTDVVVTPQKPGTICVQTQTSQGFCSFEQSSSNNSATCRTTTKYFIGSNIA